MSAKTNACRVLDTEKVAYTIHEYDWDEEALDAVTVAGKIGLPPSNIFKTLVLRGDKTGILMACVPGNKELDLKALAALSKNKKVELVSVKEIQGLTGYIRGGVSPLGVKKSYPLFLDSTIRECDPVSISAGKRGLQIFLNGQDLVKVSQGILGEISK